MIPQKDFNYNVLINNSVLVDKKINLNSDFVVKMKKNYTKGPIYTGLVLGCFITFICLILLITNQISLIMFILCSLLSVFIGVVIFKITVKSYMDFDIYNKLKKISTKNYQVYKYEADIDGFYVAKKQNIRHSLDEPLGFQGVRNNGNILNINNQKIYLDNNLFNQLKFDKKIILYFAKSNELCALIDYERVLYEPVKENKKDKLIEKTNLLKNGKIALGKIIKIFAGEFEENDNTKLYSYEGKVFLLIEFLNETGKKYQIFTQIINKEKYNLIKLNKEVKIYYNDSNIKSPIGKYAYINGSREKIFYYDTIDFYIEEFDCVKN